MKKKILIPVGMAALFLCASWQEAETTVSPDRLFLADNGKSLFITNRAGCELIKMSSDGQKIEKKVSFSSPVNAMTQDANGKLWASCTCRNDCRRSNARQYHFENVIFFACR